MNKKERGSFTGGIGFVLAAAGSAVGLGNLWRFPYLAAQYGGGIFILVYIILALTFGFTLMTTEIAIGRKTKLSPTRAYSEVNKKFGFIGPIAFIIPVIILPYYCVIGGWVTKYVTVFATGQNIAAADDSFFGSFVSQEWSPLVFFIIFLGLTSLIVILGVEKGIEKVSKFLMPVLIVLAIVICIYVITIPGSSEGIKYYLLPYFSKFSFKTVCAAMGQMFPAVYIFSGEAGTQASGAGLMFVTLPKVFGQMTAGRIIGFLFFALVFFAALTSSVSVMEAITSMIMDRFGISRIKACVGIIIFSVLLGIPCSLGNGVWADITILGMDFLTFCDFISNSLLLPVVAFLTCILIGWFAKPEYVINEATKNGETFKRELIYRVMVKYIAPVLLLIILIFYTLAQFGVISY